MIKQEFSQLLTKRLLLENNDDFGLEKIWKEEILILVKDIKTTNCFILNECSDEDLYWMSEIFEEVVQKTQSKDFINVLRHRVKKVSNKGYQKNIEQEIGFAESCLI